MLWPFFHFPVWHEVEGLFTAQQIQKSDEYESRIQSVLSQQEGCCFPVVNLLWTSPEYTRAGVYGKCVFGSKISLSSMG